MRRAVLILAVTLLVSCRLDYGQQQLVDELDEDVPETVLTEVRHTVVRDGSPRFRILADRAETFTERKRQYLHEVEFSELSPDGTLVTSGTADYAEYQMDTEDVELTGNLRFFSEEEQAWLTAEYLYWDSDSRRLTSQSSRPVTVNRTDGTRITGRGFVAEMSRSSIYFQGGVSGMIVEENEESEPSD
jgi:LPS export ABC transporter protein LptC